MDNYNKMRPPEKYGEVNRQRELDGKEFFRKNSKEFVEISCPACNSDNMILEFTKWGYKHSRCMDCLTLFCNPRPNEQSINDYYNDYKAPNLWTELLVTADNERKKIQYMPRVQKLLKILPEFKGGLALDVGAGSGSFSLALKEAGVFDDVIALDISDKCVNKCNEYGLTTIKGHVEDLPDDYVDLIVMNDLIEHVFSPSQLLSQCHRVLKKGGHIQIATPNGEGFDFKILKENTGNVTPPEHLNYFNPDSIETLLKKVGFTEVIVETPGILDVEIILKEMEKGLNLDDNNEYLSYLLKKNDLDLIRSLQDFLVKNRLSSHMLAVAKK